MEHVALPAQRLSILRAETASVPGEVGRLDPTPACEGQDLHVSNSFSVEPPCEDKEPLERFDI